MCLTTEALLLFINLLSPQIIEASDQKIVIHAQTRDAVWEARADQWCTKAPQIDAALRLITGEPV
ncbi:hypothetical protein [Aliiruegeria sabulilitoris]|uniref:hypothetical protein n=1 Tax=Aliiruegeria sabulilitoris TaxID=1510458 RepID=UPI000831D2D6|nr:hypothetical protein [Aliiruegeria sabulilitoris]NDR55808.1 hypothetical protein [Pseudoruegeria sp. M32A2M]